MLESHVINTAVWDLLCEALVRQIAGMTSLNDGIGFGSCSFHKQSVFHTVLVFIHPSEGCTDIQERVGRVRN